MPSAVELILKKRNGEELTEDEILWFVNEFTTGSIPDYQASAFLMAVCLKDMTDKETAALTQAMVRSGSIANLSDLVGPKVDKHSTGGVGDQTSLILAPIVASLGAIVPMMSGRGLGHTGGTLDKLESLPGFKCGLSFDEFKTVLRDCGVAIISTTSDMCPADRKMYALRDVTATVRAVPLQTASIMCKKLAENPDSLVLDVKTGRGAFNQDEAESIRLAQSMIAAGERDGKATSAFVTSMDQPLGNAVGNWLEVAEAIRTLRGEGPKDLEELSVQLAGQMLVQAIGAKGGCGTQSEAVAKARAQLRNGEALATFRKMVVGQGGDPASVDNLSASLHGPEKTHGASGGEVVVFRAVYGAATDVPPAPLSELTSEPPRKRLKGDASIPEDAHPPFWSPDKCDSLDKVFDLAVYAGRSNCTADTSTSTSSLERSTVGPHGNVVAGVCGLDALQVGQACVAIGGGREKLGEALSMGAGIILHKKVGDSLRQGDTLFTLFAELGGSKAGVGEGERRVITIADVHSACERVVKAFTFGPAENASSAAAKARLIRAFVSRDGKVTPM
eukprot:TRINITY_DN37744_c0_g1_i1.p1 TRINITY_DN37744_c0_g1~~TRINITY_DN37744_c0_g1_i1.p1  ORF type:complete len:561 (-),score=79.08 TRINITY_DN37744_c0_g1_i1:136-1818(-)